MSLLRSDIVYSFQSDARDVLKDHQIRNRPNKPPQPERFAFSAARQEDEIANEDEDHNDENNGDNEGGEEDSDEDVAVQKW